MTNTFFFLLNKTVLRTADSKLDGATARSRTRRFGFYGHTVDGFADASLVDQLGLQNGADERFVSRYIVWIGAVYLYNMCIRYTYALV